MHQKISRQSIRKSTRDCSPTDFTQELLYMGRHLNPSSLAAVDMHGEWSWSKLELAVTELTRTLSEFNLPSMSRVLMCGEDSIWHHIALFACANLKLIFVPITSKASSADIEHALKLTVPSLGLFSDVTSQLFASTGARNTNINVGPYNIMSWEKETIDLSKLSVQRTPLLITLTSGSTALPKPVLYSAEGEISVSRIHSSLWRLNHNDVVLTGAPLSWIYGLSTINLAGLVAGARVIIPPRFSPTKMCELAQGQDVTVFVGVTTHLRILLEHYEKMGQSPFNSKLRMIITGAERRDDQLFSKIEETFGVPVHDLYASSECRPGFGYDPLLQPVPKDSSCGQLISGTEARITSATSKESNVGTIELRSAGNFLGYFDPQTLVREEITPSNWISLGDTFRLEEEGWGFVLGRTTESIIRGGANVSPATVEAVLNQHSNVREISVIGLTSETHGEDVVAVLAGDFTSREEASHILQEFCVGKLANFQIPSEFYLIDRLPRNHNDKVDRKLVKQWAERSRT